jgi:hypothetical protein
MPTKHASDEEDKDLVFLFAEYTVNLLKKILSDPLINLVRDDVTSEGEEELPDASSPWRTNQAVKLSVVRQLWNAAREHIPDDERGKVARMFMLFLMQEEPRLIEPGEGDARGEWACLSAEVMMYCSVESFKAFWGIRGTSREWTWGWSADARSLVWRQFSNRWREVAGTEWETLLLLLGVPFA